MLTQSIGQPLLLSRLRLEHVKPQLVPLLQHQRLVLLQQPQCETYYVQVHKALLIRFTGLDVLQLRQRIL